MFQSPAPPESLPSNAVQDRILVVGHSTVTLDFLRFATIGSDDILYVSESLDPTIVRFARRFAIDLCERSFRDTDLDGVSAVLLSIGDIDRENAIVRACRRRRIAVHVADRPLVSDFTLLAWLEQPARPSPAHRRLRRPALDRDPVRCSA